jgi:LPXTG-motif cell wall-anchored protein
MHIAISNALALMRWHDFRFLHGNFRGGDFAWLLIGMLLVGVSIWALSRRKRRWF